MTIPFPYDAVAGGAVDPAEAEAHNLLSNLKWVARLIDEMEAEPGLNRKRRAQLVLHAQKFRQWYEALEARGVEARDVIEGVLAAGKVRWGAQAAMVQDLAQLYDDCGEIVTWMDANMPGWRTEPISQNVPAFDQSGNVVGYSDSAVEDVKPPALATRLITLRSRFGARPQVARVRA